MKVKELNVGDVFKITAVVCLVGAVLGLFISARKEHADKVETEASEPVPARK